MYKLVYALILYVIVMALVVYLKPETMYDKDQKLYRPFGTGDGATMFPLWLCAIVVAIVVYVLTGVVMTWTHSNDTIQPMMEMSRTDDIDAQMSLTPMRRATFGGQNMPHYETQQNAHTPHQHSSLYHMNHPQTYAKQPQQSSFVHSPHCAMRNTSTYVHPSKQKKHVQNSRVWRDVM